VQPCREEVNRIIRHYLAFDAPRELNLSHRDRAATLNAIQHTTHPSAFAPALRVCELALRGQSHPNFIRWSICNGNKPRVFFVRGASAGGIGLGFLVAILITLSKVSRWWRILAAVLWLISSTALISSYKGLCIILQTTHSRTLRPWEEDEDTTRSSFDSGAAREMQLAEKMDDGTMSYRSVSMQTFGSKNEYTNLPWMLRYERKNLLRKIFDKQVWTQDPTLRLLQDKIVLGALFWSLVATIPLTIIFVALPKGNFY
jgi:hypothetical protein